MRQLKWLRAVLGLSFVVVAQGQTYYCDHDNECTNKACCGYSNGQGICGFGDDFCGDTCISNCNATAECGKDASPAGKECPLNVCCSQYGFCGTTDDFCSSGCQGENCGYPTEPSCSSNNIYKRVIGYYESWASSRTCDSWSPSSLAVNGLTHLNYAFATFYKTEDDYYEFQFMDGAEEPAELVKEFMQLKENNPGLSLYLSIGGWSFSDGDTATYWSDMASTSKGRHRFAQGLLKFLDTYGFDGVDLDWEYPVADDRGGKAEDKDNYVALIKELRSYFDMSGDQWGLTFTTPASYWYLQNFDVPGMLEAGADWTNIMTYDLHGVWDGDDPWIGKVVGAHTNLTEIKSALDLMWRAGVDPSRVVLGLGFYGRSFTLKDPTCYEPGCPFSTGGTEGPCTKTSGVLSYTEITQFLAEDTATLYTDDTAAVNYMVWDSGQWVSFDTEATFKQKVDYANGVCLGGLMIWSLDQDTYDWEALSGLLGKDQNSNNLLRGGSMSEADAEDLANIYSAYTGGSCYITGCVDWNTGQCKDGYSVLDYVHSGVLGLIENPDDHLCKRGSSIEEDEDSQYRLICCKTETMPEGCSWEGANENGACGNPNGEAPCGDDKYELLGDLFNDRTGASRCLTGKRSLCCNSSPELSKCEWTQCTQGCTADGAWAPPVQTTYEGTNLDQEPETCAAGFSIFCCPSEDTYTGCDWSRCTDSCPSDKVLITQRTYIFDIQFGNSSHCSTGTNMYCCDPPKVAENLPVDPAYLFKYPDEDDVSYYYQVEEAANSDAGDDADTDPFAFVMIDGDPSAYDESLVDQWSFLTDEEEISKRDLKVHKRNSIFETREDTFENVEEVYHIRCSAMAFSNSTGCLSIFKGGATNTIVKMPKDIGAGPYARVVSLVPLGSTKRDVHPRSLTDTYELTVDYDFEAASASEEEKGDVNFRIDYTNLLEYWNDITDEPASKRKRWFGSFSNWLEKMTTIVKDEKGSLPLDYTDTIKLFHADTYCPKLDLQATFDIDADIRLWLNAQYAYYFEGSILPKPSLISTYAYFSIKPEAVILLTMRAEATMQVNPDPVYIISRLTFPGLSIKGLISIGPELNLIGEMDASMRVSGELNAGVALTWPRAEVYFPQNDDGEDATVGPRNLQDGDDQTFSVDPIFDATLTAEGNMDLSLTPEARFGISVLGGTLMSGYVTAGLKNTISAGFNATASYDGAASAGFCYWADYLYSLYLRADVSFLDSMAYWGDHYNVASPNKPVTLIEETCIAYSSDGDLDKRSTSDPLVANSTQAGCFGGLISCSTTIGDPSKNGTCIDYSDSGDTDEASVTKRATCHHVPAMFYNCNGDFFKRVRVMNENQNTNQLSDSITLKSICENIFHYIQRGVASQGTNFPGEITDPNTGEAYMILNYISKFENNGANREEACGGDVGGTDQCAALKESLWPTQVSAMKAQGNQATQDYQTMQGYTYSMSCDEFPFNSVEEGGSGANIECVGKAQQDYQRQVNNILHRILDRTSGFRWSQVGPDYGTTTWPGRPRTFTMNLVYNANGRPLAGGGDYSLTNSIPWDRVIGGVNMFDNPYLSLDNTNAVCAIDGNDEVWDPVDRIYKYYFAGCTVTFVSSTVPYKRGYQWEVEDVRLPDNWRDTVIAVNADEIDEFLENGVSQMLAQPHQPISTPGPDSAVSSEAAARKAQHINYHRHHAHLHNV